jgi:hypothetical protein
MPPKIRKITYPDVLETQEPRKDMAKVTGVPLMERPFYYENRDTGQQYYDIYGCIGWPTEVSERDDGRAGYVAIVGVVKSTKTTPQNAAFQLLEERESKNIPTLLKYMQLLRSLFGFGLHPTLLRSWIGDYERFVTQTALFNEKLIEQGGNDQAITITPPDDFGGTKAFDHYVRSLHSVISPDSVRFYFGGLEILKNRLREFKRDDPAVFAVGGLVHSLLLRCTWMDQTRENMFVLEEENYG